MKGRKQSLKRLLSLTLVFAMLTGLMVTGASAAEGSAPTVEDAILYTINDEGRLEYDVVYSAAISEETVVTGSDVDTIEELDAVLGTPTELGAAVTADLTIVDGTISKIEVTDVSKRPVIGISWKSPRQNYSSFLEAFDRNGGLAVELPQITDAASAQAALAMVDGIFVTGGEDWNPSLYDEVQSPHGSSGWNDTRDVSDINLMQQAIALDVPMLCVCRGEQGLNVAMGGGLIQDIPYYLGQKVLNGEIDPSRVTGVLSGSLEGFDAVQDTGYTYYNENYEKVGKTYDKETGTYMEGSGCAEGHLRVQVDGIIHSGGTKYHELMEIDPDSKWLYDIVGAESIDMIATAHHQAANPEKMGEGLTVVAYSSDGIIEALEYQDNLFALALQWHPERDALGGTAGEELGVDVDLSNAFLGALVEYAGIYDETDEDPNFITFSYPDDIPAEEVTVELYKGLPTSSSRTLEYMVENGQLVEIKPAMNGMYLIEEPGVYCYHISGEGYYNILKLVLIEEEDLAEEIITIEVVGGPLGTHDGEFGDGYQPTVKPSAAPDSYVMDARDNMLCIWNDEVLEHFTMEGTTHDQVYQTPAFDGTDAAHQFTTQEELEAFLADRDAACDYMHLYSAGTTPNYGFDIPLVIFSETEIPEDATLEEAAALVNSNEKATVWYQTQIHPNEPASGEAALVIIDNFINDEESKALLEDINLVVVPRINPDGSYLFTRATYEGFDMNRDHMSLKAAELAQLHTAYRLFMAEVVLDGHEFTFYGASSDDNGAYMSNAYDLETTPATSLNNYAGITEVVLDMCGETVENAREAGLRVYHYGTTTNNPIGRAYFGIFDCLSFLIETRGIGAGRTNFERRVFSQETAIMSYIEGTAARAEEIKEVVAEARADTIAKGAVYGEEDDLLYLYQTASGETQTEYYTLNTQYYLDGSLKREEQIYLSLNDTGERTRTRPTAYVIPADTENIEKILYIMDNQGADYYFIGNKTEIELQQYYYVGAYTDPNGRARGIEAGLRDAAAVTFENGAYVFPMDQAAADVIAMTMEPDVTDSNGYDGTLYQYGVVSYDETTSDFPIYRYIGNNPREAIPASEGIELVLDYPEDVPAEDVAINVYKGIPSWYMKYGASTVDEVDEVLADSLEEILPNADGKYIVDETGGYCYFVRGNEPGEYYNIIKLFVVSAADMAEEIKILPVKTGPSAGTGFETGYNNPVGENGETVPEGFDQGVQHLVPVEGTDEMEYLLGTDELVGYEPFDTPAFQEGRAMYQATTQTEMMDFIAEYAASSEYMHVYSAGTTSNLGYEYPVLVFTKKDIPADATMEDAAQILKDGGLPIVWQQAQIHPYEPAAGESALVMIQELCGEYGEDILDEIDVVMIPRVNVEGAFLFWRYDYNGIDMNRDHMVVSSEETALLHETYYTFMPHVVIDNHEFFFSEMGNYQGDSERFELNDFQITGATSLNDDSLITEMTVEIVDKMHSDLLDTGFRAYHYGITSNNPIGRAYYGLGNAISILIESHGADGALFAFPRRVYGQVVSTKSVYEAAAENGTAIVEAVDTARAGVAEKGATYEEDDVLVLKQSASGAVTSPTPLDRYVADIYGNIESIGQYAINLQDTIVRSRTRPTAYIVDASEEWVDDLKYILDHHNAEYFAMNPGTTIELQQYYYVQADGSKSCIADLRDAADVTFEEGAIMIPMDQEVGNIIGMLMEPDVGDSGRYNGTLFQYGLITYDETTMNLPLYRYTGDDPRDLLLAEAKVEDAILYTINVDGELEYNVTHTAGVSEDVVVKGKGIDSVDELLAVMGKVDAPAVELTTEMGQRTLGKAVTADLIMVGGEVTKITVTAIDERPIVGISWKKDSVGSDYKGFAEAFERNGAYVVFLPQITDAASAREVLSAVDGIFVTGGEDWNPALYGEEAYPHGSMGWNDARDTSDINLMQQAIALDVPMLCVCRGEQGLNVAMGGGLIQDVPFYLGQQVEAGIISEDRVTYEFEDTGITSYYQDASGNWVVETTPCETPHRRVQIDGIIHSGGTGYHELIKIDTDSKWLYNIVGDDYIDQIATAHHQSANPERIGAGLTPVAWASDGIIEALEYQDNLFALALQWHPERDALGDTRSVDVDQDLNNALLGALVDYAGIYADKQSGGSGGGGGSGSGGGSSDDEDEKPVDSSFPFKDVDEDDWFFKAVEYAYANKLFSGTSAKTFSPEVAMTRAMLVTVLYSLEGDPAVSGSSSFSDVDADDWYHDAVLWAAKNGVVAGYDDGSFGSTDIVTREQMAVILHKYPYPHHRPR